MKITDAVSSPPATTIGQTQTQTNGANSARSTERTATVPVPTDNVRLSPQVQELDRATTAAVFDTKKVEKIKLAIADGQFQVNSEKVADGLLETVKDLLHSRKR